MPLTRSASKLDLTAWVLLAAIVALAVFLTDWSPNDSSSSETRVVVSK